MSKFLDKAIKEMQNYGDMGLPDGEGGMGMGSQPSGKIVKAWKEFKAEERNNKWLQDRQMQQRAEEEEMNIDGGMRDAEMPDDEEMDMGAEDGAMDMEMGMDDAEGMDDGMDGDDTEEMKQFFQDNPAPSDEEVMQYAQERGIDMEQMRQEVYALIQSLLGDSDPVGDGEADMEMGMDDEGDMGDEIEFSAPMGGDEEIRDEEEEAKAPANRDRDVSFQKSIARNKSTTSDENASTPGIKRLKQRYGRYKRSSWGGR